jgi:hypothetical protein
VVLAIEARGEWLFGWTYHAVAVGGDAIGKDSIAQFA